MMTKIKFPPKPVSTIIYFNVEKYPPNQFLNFSFDSTGSLLKPTIMDKLMKAGYMFS